MFLKSSYQKLKNIPQSFLKYKYNSLTKIAKYYSVNTNKDKNKKEIIFFKPKNYADVNSTREKEYYDFESMNLITGVHDDYEIIKKLGQGRYSVVYEGYNVVTDERVVVKILKPVKIRRIKREVKILQNLKDGPNIVKMVDFIVDHGSKTPSIVYEYLEVVDWRELYPKLSDMEIRYYMYQILKSLNFTHSMGIIHRDLKPHNIIIKPSTMQLKIIDWGLAEFYFPGQEYSVRVASRFFKGPELLLNNTKYDYSLDIWSLGCILASIVKVFVKEPFFYGTDNFDQLVKIVKVIGTKEMYDYIDKYNLNVSDLPLVSIGNHAKKPFQKFVNLNNAHLCGPECLDLLSKMLEFDHAKRISAEDALNHPYFTPVKEKYADQL